MPAQNSVCGDTARHPNPVTAIHEDHPPDRKSAARPGRKNPVMSVSAASPSARGPGAGARCSRRQFESRPDAPGIPWLSGSWSWRPPSSRRALPGYRPGALQQRRPATERGRPASQRFPRCFLVEGPEPSRRRGRLGALAEERDPHNPPSGLDSFSSSVTRRPVHSFSSKIAASRIGISTPPRCNMVWKWAGSGERTRSVRISRTPSW